MTPSLVIGAMRAADLQSLQLWGLAREFVFAISIC
jgi:hypothetical protein